MCVCVCVVCVYVCVVCVYVCVYVCVFASVYVCVCVQADEPSYALSKPVKLYGI